MIIGLGHLKRQGKDTCAKMMFDILTAQGRFPKIISFADPLYAFCHQMYWSSGFKTKKDYDADDTGLKEQPLKNGFTPRELLLGIGEKAREVDPMIWAQYGIMDAQIGDVSIITDVRHPNEVKLLKELGATLVKVVRPIGMVFKKGDIDTYLSEYDGWDHQINNTGTLEDLRVECASVLERIFENG